MILLDAISASEDDIVVVVGRNVSVGWFHIRLIKNIFPHRNILFISRDERVRKILKQEGYKVSHSLQDIDRLLPEWFQILQENLSVFEYVRYHVARFLSRFFFITKNLKPRKIGVFEVKHSSWYMLILGIIIVLLLMIGIVSLTSPHASVIITPQTSIQNAVKNVVFVPEDALGDTNQIPLHKDTFSFELKKSFRVNTYDPTSLQKSRWSIKILNWSTESFRLRPQTRLVAGPLVFRTENWIEIPPASDSTPWEIITTVTADALGTDGVLMGKRGNIAKNTPLTFPWLSAKDSENIVVTALDDFIGGDDTHKALLTQEEYARIEKVFREEIANGARDYAKNKYNNEAEFIPLPIPDALSTLDMTVEADAQAWSQVDEIAFSGKAHFLIYLYDVSTLRKVLLQTAQNHLLENTESLVEISNSPPDIIAILTKTDDPFMVKATAQIPVQILYDFTSLTGQKTLQNILSDLLDADVDRAQKTLLNHSYVKSVDIRLTPFWSHKMPSVLDDIYIKVEKSKT